MHLQTLTLTHFRAAQDLSLKLDRQLNVFVGVNGAGKTTVLDAIALLPRPSTLNLTLSLRNLLNRTNLPILFYPTFLP